MANVLQHHIDFHPRPVSHAPSPFGFGFGLGSNVPSHIASTGWQPTTPGHTNPTAFQQLASSISQSSSSRVSKRRHEPEDDSESTRDASMDRSPTPERPKRSAPKKARVAISDISAKDNSTMKENKAPHSADDDDVDIGVLLASLPTQSLLPLLMSLLKAQPSLKSTILPLIPRPTLETAIQALASAAKKLRDAYPYSLTPTSTIGFNFGRSQNISPSFSHTSQSHSQNNGGMRDSYILSRLRPHITDFVAACMSYLPYFTCVPLSSQTPSLSTTPSQSPSTTTIQTLHKDRFHPSESFLFLSAVTNHLISQPPLTQFSLVPLLLPRLSEEWKSWVDRIDELVNRQGGMFGSETVHSWERALDEMADAKDFQGSTVMKNIRDNWIMKVGWLVGRTIQHPMDEL